MKTKFLKATCKIVLVLALLVAAVAVNKDYVEAADGSISATTIKTGDESVTDSIWVGKMVTAADGYNKTSVIAVEAKCTGLLSFYYQGSNVNSVYLSLYSDEACTNVIDTILVQASADVQLTDSISIPSAGTYYLELSSSETVDIDYTIAADIYSAEDGSLTSGKSIYCSLTSYDDVNYYKIVLKKKGTIKVFTTYADETECYADIDICKKDGEKMKVISTATATSEGSIAGLDKGTYYIKLSNGSSNYYSIRYKYTSVSDKSGTKKAKAGTLKLGTASKGLILVTDKTSKADWYKVKTTKNKTTTLKLTGEVTGGVTLEFYDADGDLFGSLYISKYTDEDSGTPYVGGYNDTSNKLPKGTYYIKVTKDSSDVSGSYSILIK